MILEYHRGLIPTIKFNCEIRVERRIAATNVEDDVYMLVMDLF